MRKKKAREPKKISKTARKLRGIKAKLFTKKRRVENAHMDSIGGLYRSLKSIGWLGWRYSEKATMKKTIKAL